MNSVSKITGALLKMERIKQDKGQKEVCYGICVPSYLSKIEHGTVKADNEIIIKLYERLGVLYEGDEGILSGYKEKIEKYFYLLHYHLDTKDLYAELAKSDHQLSYGALCIEWLIIKGMEGEPVLMQLEQLQEAMNAKQRAYYLLLRFKEYTDPAQRVSDYEEACAVISNSFAMIHLCMAYFFHGDYPAIHRMENRTVTMALEEGNTYRLAEYYFLNGSSYACLNMEEMMMSNYNRSVHFLQNTGWKEEMPDLYYNIGATYISLEKYEPAVEYLLKAQTLREKPDFLTTHKLAVAYIRKGQLKEGRAYLKKIEEVFLTEETYTELERLIYEEACMECEKDFLDNPGYIELLERLIEAIGKERHFGFLYFYKEVIVKAYKRQRKYKKALEFEQKISSQVIKTGIKNHF